MVSHHGIEASPEMMQVIKDMVSPKSIKEIHRLTGRIAAFNRFVIKSVDRYLPFFQTLKKASYFAWTSDCQTTFEELKTYISTPPLLVSPGDATSLDL